MDEESGLAYNGWEAKRFHGGSKMKNAIRIHFACLCLLLAAAGVHADMKAMIADLNLQAQADLAGFIAKVAAQFNLRPSQVEAVIAQVPTPADAFLCFRIGAIARKPVGVVVKTYNENKGKGWGVVAQELGIKPGSKEFHSLKAGKFVLTGEPAGKGHKGEPKDKGKVKEE
jgi:hypothetical protein